MTRHMRLLLVSVAILLVVVPLATALAQGGEVMLVPYSSDMFGLTGLVPDGWQEAAPGVYQRGATPSDLTALIQQAAPGMSVDQLAAALLPNLRLTALPDPVGTLETATFSWTLYYVEVVAGSITVQVDFALAETDRMAVLVVLQTTDDYDMLHTGVFLPAVEALAPLAEEPAEAVPYQQEEVSIVNPAAEGVTLAGTLTLPSTPGPHPAVVLISGSGLQDRDESLVPVAAIKPFALIADYLTRNGIAVLRYDDRGFGQSTGDPAGTSTDFATDAEAVLSYLLSRDDINPDQVGLLGHSEGGMIAPMIAARNPHVAFVITLAGPGVSGYDVLIRQNERIMAAAGADEAATTARVEWVHELLDQVIAENWDAVESLLHSNYDAALEQLPEDLRAALGDMEADIQQQIDAQMPYYKGWMRYFIMYDPAQDWRRVTVPVLAFFGGLDVQVDAEQNAPAVQGALAEAGNPDVTIITYPTANHLFQEAVTGSVEEYGTLEPNFLPDLLPTMTEWLLARVDVPG